MELQKTQKEQQKLEWEKAEARKASRRKFIADSKMWKHASQSGVLGQLEVAEKEDWEEEVIRE